MLLSDVLPALYRWNGGAVPVAVEAVGKSLLGAGILENGDSEQDPQTRLTATRVSALRRTPFVRRILEMLDAWGIETAEASRDGDFIVSDLTGLQDDVAREISQELQQRGCPSISIWTRGDETFLGPLAWPGSTGCWHCARVRLDDSLQTDIYRHDKVSELVQAVAENVLLALRYPRVAGYGCLVAIGQSATIHSVLPVPWCRICGGTATSNWAALNHSLLVPEALRSLADPRAGLIRRLFIANGGDLPELPISASAVIARPPLPQVGAGVLLQGEGKGATRDEAVVGAIGEGIERYAASIWNVEEMTLASFDLIESQAFDPAWLVLYSAEQYATPGFAFEPFDRRKPMLWQRGRWLESGVDVLVPAQAVYFDFTADERRFAQTTSNGLAAGTSSEDAALRALYELIERDAFMLYWLSGSQAERIDPDGCDEISRKALDEVHRFGATTELYLLDVGTGFPTVICVGMGDGISWPGATIGLGTHANIDIAFRKAVLEHGHYGPYMRRLMREDRHRHVRVPEDVAGTVDHGLFYCHAGNVAALQKLGAAGTTRARLANLRKRYKSPANLAACVQGLMACGIRTAAVDLTTPDLASAGLHVIRAFGTFAQPIHFGFRYERVVNPRLYTLAKGPIQVLPHPIA